MLQSPPARTDILVLTILATAVATYPLFSLLGSGDNVNIDIFEQAEDLLCQGAFPEGLPA